MSEFKLGIYYASLINALNSMQYNTGYRYYNIDNTSEQCSKENVITVLTFLDAIAGDVMEDTFKTSHKDILINFEEDKCLLYINIWWYQFSSKYGIRDNGNGVFENIIKLLDKSRNVDNNNFITVLHEHYRNSVKL